MDIEAVAEETPEKIINVAIDPISGITDADVASLCDGLKLEGVRAKMARHCFRLCTRRLPKPT